VTAITEDPTPKMFWPGGHTQALASYVRCEIPFNDYKPPVLHLKPFKGKRSFDYFFDATRYDELTLTMSNLCNDIGIIKYLGDAEEYVSSVKKYGAERTVDDPEFTVYYQLLSKPGLDLRERPVPTMPITHGAIRIPVCYAVARLELA
jgi:hypothetical protein